jgi:hypothetical protein
MRERKERSKALRQCKREVKQDSDRENLEQTLPVTAVFNHILVGWYVAF